ncbi:MAG: 2-succinyl-5-enolpyruvyl-6-hydroxy-3-cyclohexene-1-carboxylic-acid synthase [Flammeovirgaceae bacterium]|nr:2-succinyl-5-enolpyruvyl-6-hydroxy-3-cyclohexene-1-carboxylic-acid synthase [Flammeovirgaceae bacterium]HCX21341.1 2-succinyl-5-enolpyruvyl-6-hydroxy-3-cyclohexene-1-carboxylic-acid synthase [Cytophagales bacterium]|tara:strand:- start:1547 stop:3235 length:1689 start_codon:yes stop_codon:yes gene_type:complete
MINQTVFDTSEVFALKGIKHVVLSPGSRNAPLTISFARNPKIKTYNIVDERSAGFIALGIAQKLKQPVVLCCTSGTSLLNYAPSVAEAYYQGISLIVLSADRPAEWIGQKDGQTIDQLGALTNFVKGTFNLPANPVGDEAWEYTRKLNEAINTANSGKKAPVHINIPFREPFYPAEGQELSFSKELKVFNTYQSPSSSTPNEELLSKWHLSDRRMIIVGQNEQNQELDEILASLSDKAIIIADVISNNATIDAIRHHDLFLASIDEKLGASLRPELVITIGKSVISKNLKLFLRKYKPEMLWQISPQINQADTFQALTSVIESEPTTFLQSLDSQSEKEQFNQQVTSNFIQNWQIEDSKTKRKLNKALEVLDWSEFTAMYQVIKSIPAGSDVHLANSMPVRFANFIQQLRPDIEIFCNRGTSGIDGTNGTAVGHAMITERSVYLITGDLSFFYDRNAFFHPYELDNLKIIVSNNQGGGIFRLINGPSNTPELVQHFETRHEHTAKFTALEYGFDYHGVKDADALEKALKAIHKDNRGAKLVEIFTDPEINSEVFKAVKAAVK